MKRSPIGSKVLSVYAVLIAGLGPVALAVIGLVHGMGPQLLLNVVLGAAIVYYGVRVFMGDSTVVKIFATLVIVHYLGVVAVNIWNYGDFPTGSRAHRMAFPRVVRGVIFAAAYGWYYLLRSKTMAGFHSAQQFD